MARAPARKKPPKEVEVKPPSRPDVPPPAAPLRLSQVLGQDRAVGLLRAAVQAGRIHHAWIFHGPTGVGKFTTALAFAALILDPSAGPDLSGQIEADPESRTQKLLAAGTHPDLHIVSKELASVSREAGTRDSKQKTIAKDVLEEFLIEPATRSRGSGEKALASKVFIVDEAELMDRSGQNALLKTLEEPPAGCVIILVTSSEDRLLTTVRSRCQPVPFAPLSMEAMTKWLKGGSIDLGGLDAASREWLLSYAAGSPGVATTAVATGLVPWHAALAPMLADLDKGRYPADLGQTMAKLVDEWAAARVESAAGGNVSKDAANKASQRHMFRLLSEHYRARLRHAAAKGDGVERATTAISLIAEAERQAEASVQSVFVFENLVARIAGLTPAH